MSQSSADGVPWFLLWAGALTPRFPSLGNREWHEDHERDRVGRRCAGAVVSAVGGGIDPAVPDLTAWPT